MNTSDPWYPGVAAVQCGSKYYIYLRGDNMQSLVRTNNQLNTNLFFNGSADSIDCTGNIMSLLDYDNPDVQMTSGAFKDLFNGCSPLRTAPALPATTLAPECYYEMFNGCSNLKVCNSTDLTNHSNAIAFFTCPSGTLPTDCVTNMFSSTTGSYNSDPVVNETYYYY